MRPWIFFALAIVLLTPGLSFAQKPDCETIRKIVEAGRAKEESDRAKELEKLESEKVALDKLRNDIRRGRAKLDGKDGRKPRREQLQIVVDKIKANEVEIKANEVKIEEVKKSFPFPVFQFSELKAGHFGHFGRGSANFRVQEIIDGETFTAFLEYSVQVPNPGGIVAFRPERRLSSTLYFVKGIKTEGLVDKRSANWTGYLYCSGTKKLQLNKGNETVFVLEPLDVESCFKKKSP